MYEIVVFLSLTSWRDNKKIEQTQLLVAVCGKRDSKSELIVVLRAIPCDVEKNERLENTLFYVRVNKSNSQNLQKRIEATHFKRRQSG